MSEKTNVSTKLNCCLTDQEKENLKNLYTRFKEKKEKDQGKENWKKKANTVLVEFNKYKQKIEKRELSLDGYTNIKSDDEIEYLCDFLENRSDVFGGARPAGSADSYMVKKNDVERMEKGKKVFNGPYTIASLNKRDATKVDAEKAYKKEIVPLLEKNRCRCQ